MKVFWAERDPVNLIRLANAASLGKERSLDSRLAPLGNWYFDTVLEVHSTLDWASVVFVDHVRSDVVSHLVRHTKGLPRFVVGSWRPDWTGNPLPRSPEEIRILASKWTIRALQAMGRERLCYKAMKETREYVAFEMRDALIDSEDTLMMATGWSMVPVCVYRFGCPFKKSCGFWDRFLREVPILQTCSISRRYAEYDDFMHAENEKMS